MSNVTAYPRADAWFDFWRVAPTGKINEGPELDMWIAFFKELVDDAMGVSPWANHRQEHCAGCHDMVCGCKPYKHARTRIGYHCKNFKNHTYQKCAINFINLSPVCEDYCTMLGLSVSYLRRMITKQ